MDHFLHHRRAARYAALSHSPPPQHPLNPHYHCPDLSIPRSVIVNPTAPDSHPPALVHNNNNPLFIHRPPVLLDLDFRRHLSMASSYSPKANPNRDSYRFGTERFDASPNNRRVVFSPRVDSWASRDFGVVAGKRRAKNWRGTRGLRDSNDDEKHASELVQRKSVFLRIQMPEPNYGNGENDETQELHHDDYAVDSSPNSNSSRGKQGRSGNSNKVKRRGRSDFDISLESDSLIARPITVPLSSAIVSNSDMTSAADSDLTPKGKKRKTLVFDFVSSDSKLNLTTGFLNSNSSPCLANETSSSGKDLILEKNVSNPCSKPCSGSTNNPSSAIASNSNMTSVADTDSTPKRKRRKKKKRKALVSGGVSSDPQLVKVSAGAVNSNSSPYLANENSKCGKDLISQKNGSDPCAKPCSDSTNSPPIAAPLSSAIVSNSDMTSVADTDLTPTGKKKKRKALVFDRVSSDPKLVKLSTCPVNSNSSPCLANEISSSGKDLLISQKNVSDSCSKPCSGSTNNPPGKIKVAQSSEGIVKDETANMHSGKTSTRVVKKKIIVKKVIKKVVKPNSTRSSSLSTKMLDGTVKADGAPLSTASAFDTIKKTSMKYNNAAATKVSIVDCFRSLPSEGNLFGDDNKGDAPVPSLVTHSRSEECNTDKDFDVGSESGGNISKTPSCASSKEDERTDPDCSGANNSAMGLLSNSVPDTDEPTQSLNGSTPEIYHDDKRSCQDEESLSTGKDSNVGSLQSKYHVGDAINCRLLNSADNVSNIYLPSTHNSISASDRVAGLSSNDLKCRSEEDYTVCDIGIVVKACCENDAPTLSQGAILEENPDIAIPGTSSGMDGFSSSAKTVIQDGQDGLQQASVVKQGSDNERSNSEDIITFPHADIMEDAGMQVPPNNVIASPEKCDIKSFPNSDTSVRYGDGDTMTLNVKRGVSEAGLSFGNNDENDASKVSGRYKRNKTTFSYTNFTHCPSEPSDATVATTSCAEDPIMFSDKQTHKEEVTLLSMAILSASPSVPRAEDSAKLHASSLGRESSESMDFNKETVTNGSLDLQHSSIASRSLLEHLATPYVQFSLLEDQQKEAASPSVPYAEYNAKMPDGSLDKESVDCMNLHRETVTPESLVFQHSSIASHSFLEDLATSNGQFKTDALSALPSRGIASQASDKRVSDRLESNNENICRDGETMDCKSITEKCSDLLAFTSFAQHTGKIMLGQTAQQSNPSKRKMKPQPSLVPFEVATQKSKLSESNWSKKESGCIFPKTSNGHSFNFSKSKATAFSTQISKPRTWHRTDNNSTASLHGSKPSARTVPPKKSIPEMKWSTQNTLYIRKGNSLVRKPTPLSAPSQITATSPSPSLAFNELRKGVRSKGSVNVTDQRNLLETGVKNAPLEGQKVLPLPIDTKLQNASSPMKVNLSVGCCENATDSKDVIETDDVTKTSEYVLKNSETFENQIGPSNNRANQVEVNDGSISSSNAKRIVYLKPKSNQLVATSNSCDLLVYTHDYTHTMCSDGYYKKSENQLLRTSFVSACKVIGNRRFMMRRSQKVAGGLCKSLKAPLLWTLCGKNSSKNVIHSGHHQKFLPKLFAWKRSIFLRRSVRDPTSMSNGSFLSAISYARIGNGNQLIRDPKKRTMILANEKVRWSLHTARQRLARKQKCCQFFTRYGKCNKDDGKCPYIHDPSKIAVCTKFLNGLCSNANCELTHEVIPEKMPDCSYFLKGLCTNRNCSYRHVNVNPKASICEEFLKGYCGDGDECRKKHSYVCPTFEATGNCEKGTDCKLHHPKKQSDGRKRKRSGDQYNRRRY